MVKPEEANIKFNLFSALSNRYCIPHNTQNTNYFVNFFLERRCMPHQFNSEFIDQIITRLQSLPLDRSPLWGSLTAPGVLGHLTESLRYSLGHEGDMPSRATFVTIRIVKPLILGGVLKFPKGVKGVALPFETGDVGTLRATMEEFRDTLESGSKQPKPHPIFGPLTLDEWARFHVLHFKHHMTQFNI